MSKEIYESPFCTRYASKEMQAIFSPDTKFRTWRKLWVALARAEHKLGLPVSEAYMEDGVCRITDRFSIQQAAAMALFVLLQQILFAQMYGRADCHAFSVCALAGCAWQGNLLWFLIHMLSALTLLAAVQFCRRNVTPDGKLRVPKPFIPYIVVTFWVQIPVMLYLQSGATHIYA